MTLTQLLGEWALRSSVLILGGALVLLLLRVKDPAVRLAAWTAMLAGSLAIPVLRETLPKMTVTLPHAASARVETPADPAPAPVVPLAGTSPSGQGSVVVRRFDWSLAAAAVWAVGALVLLLRVGIGLAAGWRLWRSSQRTGTEAGGIEIRESQRVSTPLTLGMVRPVIVLPADWREWERPKLDAVLAHERSHVRRFDPAVQLMSAIHRALLWHSPLSWFLHRRIVRLAEETSDDAAVAATCDRPSYAEILVEFMSGPVGVPMGRYGSADRRIHRILEGTVLSRGLTRWSVAAILALGGPVVYFAGAATPRTDSPARPAASEPARVVELSEPEQAPSQAAHPATAYIEGLGTVTPSATVTVRPLIDGPLASVDFKEGETVEAGQLLATIDPRPYQAPLAETEAAIERDQELLSNAQVDLERYTALQKANAIPLETVSGAQAEVVRCAARLRADQSDFSRAKLALSYTEIRSPISGVAGLRQVDAGNVVHTTDSHGIVVITQVQPVAVVFTIPEDRVVEALARLRSGARITVEAWNRDVSRKLATGQLTAVDNQIDMQTGMAKLKAVFENKDSALMGGAFVNVRMFLDR